MRTGMTRMIAAAFLMALSACSTAPGTGWSRAGDLSVYASMNVYARAARDQEVLCAGFSPASTADNWERLFGARHEAVTDALELRYGAAAVSQARRTWAPSVACRALADPRWRLRYERQLRLLETRLQLAAEEES
jgi:hypothetical protein